MTTFHSFEDIEAWQEARKLTRAIRKTCKKPTVRKDFPFVDQITRAARSITANIAEGFESMTNPTFIMFLGYAKRSAGEVGSHLYDALDENYISQEEFDQLAAQTKKICRMIAKLIHYLQSLDPSRQRTSKNLHLQTNNQQLINQ